MKTIIPLLARIMLSILFLGSALKKIVNVDKTLKFMIDNGMETGTEFFLTGAIIILVAGGISLLLGYKSRLGALLLILFMVITTVIFHWDLSNSMQVVQLEKNMAIIGGLLMVVAYGPGLWSISKT